MDAFVVSTNCEQHGEVHGERIDGDVDVGYGCELWR